MTTLNARETALLAILSNEASRNAISQALQIALSVTQPKTDVIEAFAKTLTQTVRFTVSDDGLTVADAQTGLVWQQAGSDKRYDFADAAGYIESLNDDEFGGFDDWRLPTDHELCSIVDRSRYNPAIDSTFGCQPNYYLTSTPLASSSVFVWVVYFYNGHVYSLHRGHDAFVRAVRGPSPAGQ
jgi:hypothetical protein